MLKGGKYYLAKALYNTFKLSIYYLSYKGNL